MKLFAAAMLVLYAYLLATTTEVSVGDLVALVETRLLGVPPREGSAADASPRGWRAILARWRR